MPAAPAPVAGPPAAAVAPARELWPDAAKGVLILLVVLWHATMKHYAVLPWVPAPVDAAWQWLNLVAQPVRVPLFFVLSGYLSARALHRPWPALLRGRVLPSYWTYLVWLVLASAFFAAVPGLTTATAHTARELLLGALVGYSNAWYLFALAAYAVVARACVRLPLRVALGLAVVVAVVADLPWVPSHGNTEALLRNLGFFLVAALRPELVDRVVGGADRRAVALTAVAYLPAVSLAVAADLSAAVGLRVALSSVGVVLGLQLAVCATRRWTAGAAALGRLGRRTLPVYVLHLPLLALLHEAAAAAPPLLGPGPGRQLAAAVYPLLAVAALTAASLGLHRLLAGRLGVLFAPPRALSGPATLRS